ncbi:MAG: dethiobiotin synthase [Oceanospirillales bacterium LUC14_002_19_P2]|nr:MAG: dethiobiotin synthase [Oceanospirillales bacterium LUC14_002_19_P2]
MSKAYFVTGTDTDAGKTLMSCGLLEKARQKGLTTAAVKPVSAGCEETPEGLRNADALALHQVMTMEMPYEQVNPVAFLPPIAPHIAAQDAGRMITADRLAGICRGVLMKRADFTLLEGAGGWRVPLNPRETLADLARMLQLPVILVVGMKLGCLNHALLTAEAIRRDGLTIAGWVANSVTPDMARLVENTLTLEGELGVPCLGEVPYLDSATPTAAAEYLNLPA